MSAVAVLDFGKTNIKLLAIDPAEGRILESLSTANTGRPPPPYLHVDLAASEAWLLAALCDWAAGKGAEQAWLAAAAGDDAMDLPSRDLGFRRAYTYHYRSLARPLVRRA
jgi:hypothetical protein